METEQSVFGILSGIALIIAFPVCIYAFARIFLAKNRKDYWKYIALFVVPILLVFFLAELSGEISFDEAFDPPPQQAPDPMELFARLSTTQIVLLGLAAAVWVLGANIILIRARRRTGKSWWQFLNPFDPPFKDLTGKDWFAIFVLVVVAFALANAAISLNPNKVVSDDSALLVLPSLVTHSPMPRSLTRKNADSATWSWRSTAATTRDARVLRAPRHLVPDMAAR